VNQEVNKEVKVSPVDINIAHWLSGHVSMDSIKQKTDHYGLKLKGDFVSCADCALAQKNEKNVPQTKYPCATQRGERLFLGISYTVLVSFMSERNSGC
jgi:hypothetical protein